MLYGKGAVRLNNLKTMRDILAKGSQDSGYSDYYRAKIRRRIKEIDEGIFSKRKVKGDKVGVVKYVKVYIPTDFYQVRY